MFWQISETSCGARPSYCASSGFSNRLREIIVVALLVLSSTAERAFAQDERCVGAPGPQCQCSCREVRTAASFAPRGTCRVIEPGNNSCQLRWLDAARGNDEKLADPAGASRIQLEFLKRVRDGELGAKTGAVKRESLTVEALMAGVRRNDRRLPPDPIPLEVAAAYLSLDPEKQEAEQLLTSYLIVLGPPVLRLAGDKTAAALIEFLALESKSILERIRSNAPPPVRTYKTDAIDLRDESAHGCLELIIRAPGRTEPFIAMVKTPRSIERPRCRE
jgi:hypothetical protein